MLQFVGWAPVGRRPGGVTFILWACLYHLPRGNEDSPSSVTKQQSFLLNRLCLHHSCQSLPNLRESGQLPGRSYKPLTSGVRGFANCLGPETGCCSQGPHGSPVCIAENAELPDGVSPEPLKALSVVGWGKRQVVPGKDPAPQPRAPLPSCSSEQGPPRRDRWGWGCSLPPAGQWMGSRGCEDRRTRRDLHVARRLSQAR